MNIKDGTCDFAPTCSRLDGGRADRYCFWLDFCGICRARESGRAEIAETAARYLAAIVRRLPPRTPLLADSRRMQADWERKQERRLRRLLERPI